MKIEDIENKFINREKLTKEEIDFFLRYVVEESRRLVGSNDNYYQNKCDLVQSIIACYFDEIGIDYVPGSTLESISSSAWGHNYIIASFNIDDCIYRYLVDPTYIQFFKNDNNLINPPTYYIDDKDMNMMREFSKRGYAFLDTNIAKAYGDSFYLTSPYVGKFKPSGDMYLNAFLKIRTKLTYQKEDLVDKNMVIEMKKNNSHLGR